LIFSSAIDGIELKKVRDGSLDKKQNSQGIGVENESFNKNFNKELKVSEGNYLCLIFR
jgi:hypothetical protein